MTALTASLALLLSLLVAPAASALPGGEPAAASPVSATVGGGPVKAAAVTGFNPENIISDDLFYDGAAMTAAQIQSFLDEKIGACRNGKCLNVSTAGISSRGALVSQSTGNLICSAIQGGTMRVSELIYRVQKACGISAKVILVTLQKEQGLTTSKAPSDWNLKAAMGASCPDTAPCDPAFAGLGPQILKGAQQLKTYKAAKFAKQPGVHFIGYNPSASCGGTNLNIRNHATAALYNYTPYQPNAAALAAGFGLGNSCSAYGNRNFFLYYTQWFGPTQAGVALSNGLVNVGDDIYLVSDGARYHITFDQWPAYQAAFGAPRAVTASALAGATDRGAATSYLRNTKDGTVAFLEGGAVHRFPNCELVATWGGSCSSGLTHVGDATFRVVKQGVAMTQFARLDAAGRVHRIEDGILVPFLDAAAVRSWTGVTDPFAAVMSATLAAQYRVDSKVRIAAGTLVKASDRDKVWIVTGAGAVHYLPSFDIVRELGLSTAVKTVSKSDLSAQKDRGTLSPIVRCGDANHFAASGLLYRVGGEARTAPTSMSTALCNLLKKSSDKAAPIFIKTADSSKVHVLRGTTIAHVPSYEALRRAAGSSAIRILTVRPGTLAQFATEPFDAAFAPGNLVVATGDPKVWLSAGDGRIIYVPDFGIVTDLGLRTSFTRVPAGELSGYRQAGTLSPSVACEGSHYLGASGSLYPLAADPGIAAVDLGSAVCGVLKTATRAVELVAVKTASSPDVYVLRNGKAQYVPTMARLVELAGGKAPHILTVTAGTLAQFR